MVEYSQWTAAVLASLVSILTLYNAARLKSGILAVSTYATGTGMVLVAGGFFLQLDPGLINDPELAEIVYNLALIAGFCLMGGGSFKILQMSRIK